MPSPRNVGPNSAVARGIGKFANASRGAPDSVYSMNESPSGFVDVVEERAELRAGELDCRVRDRLHHALEIELARQRRAGPVQDLPLLRLAAQVTFHRPLRRHVAHRGARTDELAVDEQRTGVDHHILGRAVLAAHLHVLVAQRLAGLDALEQRSRLARLHDEVRDRPADELLGRVAEHVELRPVRPR